MVLQAFRKAKPVRAVRRGGLANQITLQRQRDLRLAQNAARPIVRDAVRANTPVRTGELRGSTQVFFRQTSATILQRFYGEFVNFGTRYIFPRRFIERAIRQARFGGLRMVQQKFRVWFTFNYFRRRVG